MGIMKRVLRVYQLTWPLLLMASTFGQQPRYRTAIQMLFQRLEPASHGDGSWEDRGWRERGDDGRTYTLLTSGDAGDTGGSR
jgi:hypothetical protein